MTTFPYVTVFALYESRKSLYTLASRMYIFMLGFLVMVTVLRFALQHYGMALSLFISWIIYIAFFLFFEFLYKRRANKIILPDAEVDLS